MTVDFPRPFVPRIIWSLLTGVMAMDLSFEGIADSNMNYAPYKITVVNGVAAL